MDEEFVDLNSARVSVASLRNGPLSPSTFGNKAAALSRVLHLGVKSPEGVAISFETFSAWRSGQQRHLVEDVAVSVLACFPVALGEKAKLAVRSSSEGEDNRGASAAGQYATVLDVSPDPVSLTEAILTVYRSAVGYGSSHRMAVVVSEFIVADWSGVAFGADPISGDGTIAIIEAAAGNSAAVAYDGRELLRWRFTQQGLAGPVGHPLDTHLERIVDYCRALSAATSYDQGAVDIEWVCVGDEIWIMQVRDIAPPRFWSAARLQAVPLVWSDANLRDSYPFVQTPLSWSMMRAVTQASLLAPFRMVNYSPEWASTALRLINGRAYLNMTAMYYWFWDCFGVSPSSLKRVLGGHEEVLLLPRSTPIIQRISRLGRIALLLRRAWPSIGGISSSVGTMGAVKNFDDWLEATVQVAAEAQIVNFSAGIICGFLEKLCRQLFPRNGRAFAYLTSGSVASVRMSQMLSSMVVPGSSEIDARSRSRFLDQFGHHAERDLDITSPRWSEGFDVDQIWRASAAAPASSASPSPGLRLLRAVIGRAAAAAASRESHKERIVEAAAQLRRIALARGSEMVAEGILESPEEIFYLSHHEITMTERRGNAGSSLSDLARARRAEKNVLESERHESTYVFGLAPRSQPTKEKRQSGGRSVDLTGLPAAAGAATGRVWHVSSYLEVLDAPADAILVAESADASWVPAIVGKRGLILEAGGVLSHVAIACRELGVPAVVNVPHVKSLLRAEEQVEMDGMAGVVRRRGAA